MAKQKRSEEQEIVITRAIKLGGMSVECKLTEKGKLLEAVVKNKRDNVVDRLDAKQLKALEAFFADVLEKENPKPVVHEHHYHGHRYWNDWWYCNTQPAITINTPSWDNTTIMCSSDAEKFDIKTDGITFSSNSSQNLFHTPEKVEIACDAVVTNWVSDTNGNVLDIKS